MDAVLYMRKSTDKQENSIDSQREILKHYAKKYRMNVLNEYVDEGISGRNASRRPSFLQMIDDSEKGLFQTVLVYDSSRFARNLEESLVYKSALKRNGVQLISVTEPTFDEDTSLISDAMLGAINEMYSRKLSKSVLRGMTYRSQQGYHVTPAPFGYANKESVLIQDHEEAAIVKRVYNLFIEKPSYHSIAVQLNSEGIPKRSGTKWSSIDIKRMLQKKVYIGKIEYNGEVFEGKHAGIVDNNIFAQANSLIKQKTNRKSRSESTYKHWLSGLVKCGKCGSRMNHVTDWRGNRSYRCSGHANGRCNYSSFMAVNKLEKLTINALKIILSEQVMLRHEYFVPKIVTDTEQESIRLAIKKIDAKIKRFEDAYENGIDTLQEYGEKKKKALTEKAEHIAKLQKLDDKETVEQGFIDLKQKVITILELLCSDDYSIEEKSFSLKSIIDKIILNKYTGEYKVYYFL